MTSYYGGIHTISTNKKEGNIHSLKWRVNKTKRKTLKMLISKFSCLENPPNNISPKSLLHQMRSPNSIMNLTKNPHHHLADASLTSVMGGSSSNSTASNRRDWVCKCGKRPMLTTSWTDNNPSRRFFGCRNYYVSFDLTKK